MAGENTGAVPTEPVDELTRLISELNRENTADFESLKELIITHGITASRSKMKRIMESFYSRGAVVFMKFAIQLMT